MNIPTAVAIMSCQESKSMFNQTTPFSQFESRLRGADNFRRLFKMVVFSSLFIPLSTQATNCENLLKLEIAETSLQTAVVVPADDEVPEHCRVRGYVRPAIHFEVRLPLESWNSKFYMAGCGGLCGVLADDPDKPVNSGYLGLKRQYATAITDTGHWGQNAGDGRWAYSNIVARADYAYRGVTETARVAKALIASFYGKTADKSYFEGCSNGGRQALMEAQRYPEDFDGIIASAPVTDMAGFVAQYIWNIQANTDRQGKLIFNPSKLSLLQHAVTALCADEDGLINDPSACPFDPAILQCKSGDATTCLNKAEVAVLHKWYGGPKSRIGDPLHLEGMPLGSESSWQDFAMRNGWKFLMDSYVKYLIFDPAPGPDYEVMQFDLDNDLPKIKPMTDMMGPTDPDLSTFGKGGGKLLIYSGWADPMATPLTPVAYYEQVEKALGGRDAAQDVVRLFMIPGMGHCGGGQSPGIDARGIDPLTALEQWVERDEAPGRLLTTKFDNDGNIKWTRPVCVYPQVAVYNGIGDRSRADNWLCRNP